MKTYRIESDAHMFGVDVCQIKTRSGDIIGNATQIKEYIASSNSSIIVFPETAITGYMCGSLWENVDFLKQQEKALIEISELCPYDKLVIIGFISFRGLKRDGYPRLYNSAAAINNGKIQIYDKQLLANANHHEDKKYFEPGEKTIVMEASIGPASNKKFKFSVLICEDVWYHDHERNLAEEAVSQGAEMLFVINQSYFYYGKYKERYTLIRDIARNNSVPVVYVNGTGIGDIVKNIVIFDGGSFVVNAAGNVVDNLGRFQRERKVINPFFSIERNHEKKFTKYEEIVDAIIFEQREFFNILGIKRAQVHVSGGIDSLVTASIMRLAMGKENCIFITNPTSLNKKSTKYNTYFEKEIGIPILINPLQSIYDEFIKVDTKAFGEPLHKEGKSAGNSTIQAVLRTVQGLAASHRFKTGIVATGNHTEIVLGWASFHDIGSIGVHAPIGDLSKLEVFQIAKYLNEEKLDKPAIHTDLYDGTMKPAAELPDANEDPIDYNVQSGICCEIIRNRKTLHRLTNDYLNGELNLELFGKDLYKTYDFAGFVKQLEFTASKVRTSVYKAAQGAPILILSPRSRGFSSRETLINLFSGQI